MEPKILREAVEAREARNKEWAGVGEVHNLGLDSCPYTLFGNTDCVI
jgi:hypothetical protein